MTPRRKTSVKRRLEIARAVNRVLVRIQGHVLPASQPKAGPPQFIQCWAVSGRPVTQALDSEGQVWERIWRKATATTSEESWWEPLSMERRQARPVEPPEKEPA